MLTDNFVVTVLFASLLDTPEGYAQIWIIGDRDQVIHLMNEFYVKRIATDRVQFTPLIPAPFAAGKYMTLLVR